MRNYGKHSIMGYNFLKKLGFSRQEIEIYVKLVTEGPLTAKEISREVNIPYMKLYSMLKRLESKGVVRKDKSKRPQKYFAEPPMKIYEIIREEVISQLEKLGNYFKTLQEMYETSHLSHLTRTPVELISGKRGVSNLVEKIFEETSRFIYMAIPFKDLLDLLNLFQRINYDQIEVKILIAKNLLNNSIRIIKDKPIPLTLIRLKDKMFGFGFVTEKHVLLAVKSDGEIRGIHSSAEYFIEIARVYFNFLWDDSEKLSSI